MKHRKQITHSPKDILDELRALVADAEKMVGDSLADNSEEVVNALRARYDDVQERLSEIFDGAKKTVVAGARSTDDTIRENPYSSIAVAAIAGVLVGVLLSRRGGK
jgi:ElaB/YqjD/DUF883 family membrane-anchored ribosome-binding protein